MVTDLVSLLTQRNSARNYTTKKVSVDKILEIIRIACLAPSGGNYQPWHFHIISDSLLKREITKLVEDAHKIVQSFPDFLISNDPYWYKKSSFTETAPVLIAVSVNLELSRLELLLKNNSKENRIAKEMLDARQKGNSRLQSIGAVISNILLLCEKEGLGACWMASPQLAKKDIEIALSIDDKFEFVALISVGYSEDNINVKQNKFAQRKLIEEVVTIIE